MIELVSKMRLAVVIFAVLLSMFLAVEAFHPYAPLIKGKAVGAKVGAKKLHLVQKAALAKLIGAKKVGIGKKKVLIGKKIKAKKIKVGLGAAGLKKKALIKKPLIFYG